MALFLANFDFETAVAEPGMGVPPWVCFSWETRDEALDECWSGLVTVNGEYLGDMPPGYVNEYFKVDPLVVLKAIFAQVKEKADAGYTSRLINQNIPFDNLVACNGYEELITPIFALYREGLVEDPMIREMLIDLAAGYLGYFRKKNPKNGKLRKRKYDLGEIAMARLGIFVDKKNEWRKKFWTLVETPLSNWPKEAIDYVRGDSTASVDVYLHQRAEVMEDLPDGEIPDSVAQSRAHWALNLAAAWGIRTHPGRVSAFKRQLEIDLDILKKGLQTVGFIRTGSKESKNKKVIEEYLVRIAETVGFELPRTSVEGKSERYVAKNPDGAIKQGAAVIDDLLESLNINFFEKEEGKTEQQQAIDLAKSMIEGRLGSGNVLTVQVGGERADDDDEEEEEKTVLPEKVVNLAERDLKALAILSFHTSTQKLLKTYVPPMEHGTRYPINPYFHPVLETGRISCRNPNLTNLPRAPGVRECYIPREGWVFSSVDYSSMELHTLAQCCFSWLGESRLGEALNDGIDPHLQFAVDYFLDGISYSDAKRIIKSEDKNLNDVEKALKKQIKQRRNVAKCFHPDTEFLTKQGWRKFDALDENSEIMQASPNERGLPVLTWAKPTNLFDKESEELVHLKGEGIDLHVTPDHRMLFFNAQGKPGVCNPEELNKKRGWYNAGHSVDEMNDLEISLDFIRFLVATQADGSYQGYGHTRRKQVVRFGFSKARKINRFKALLDKLLIEYPNTVVTHRYYENEKMGKTQHWEIEGELAKKCHEYLPNKVFPWEYIWLPEAAREAILDEARYWDGHTPSNGVAYSFSTSIYQNAEVLQTIATMTGRKSRLVLSAKESDNRNNHWKLTIRTKGDSRGENLQVNKRVYNGRVVCLSVPSSYVVVRHGGVPVITGQCSNFGLPGGLGATTFVQFCKASGVIITEDEAREIKANWLQMWPEMKKYFKHINGWMYEDDEGNNVATVEQLFSGRIRGRTRYTAACNTGFQGLGADLAKYSCFLLQEACYVPGVNPILYGSRLVCFVHDESIMEHPLDETTHDRAMEQTRIMLSVSPMFVPDVPLRAEPALMSCWTKDAEAMYDENKRLIPWTPAKK